MNTYPPLRSRAWAMLPWVLAMLYGGVVLTRAWQGDDAYITWRQAENLLFGEGLTYNPNERVQAFTSPLWLAAGTAQLAFFGEVYFSILFFSALLSAVAALALAFFGRRRPLQCSAVLLTLTASATLVDFGTSGLETPLLLLLTVLATEAVLSRRWTRLAALTATLFLCRPDALVPLLPALPWALWRQSSLKLQARFVVLAGGPILCWTLFSVFYFGAPVPNTALAKLNSSVPRFELMQAGLDYVADFARFEPLSALVLIIAITLGITSRRSAARLLASGVLVHLAYVVWIGGDFMRGRFLLQPLVVALTLLLLSPAPSRFSRSWSVGLFAAGFLGLGAQSTSPLRELALESPMREERRGHVVNERSFYAGQTGLAYVLPHLAEFKESGQPIPPLSLASRGRHIRVSGKKPPPLTQVGFTGFFAGQDAVISDSTALTDPFMSRVPFLPGDSWRVGHLYRGHALTRALRRVGRLERFPDPALEAAYQDVLLVTEGALGDSRRLGAIWRINIGTHRDAFERFATPMPSP